MTFRRSPGLVRAQQRLTPAAPVGLLKRDGLTPAAPAVLRRPEPLIPAAPAVMGLLDDGILKKTLIGTWTPVLTFNTPGDLSVAYTTQSGDYVRTGRHWTLAFNIVTSSFTHTTASGNLLVTGQPVAATTNLGGSVRWQGVTKANYTQITPRIGSSSISFHASGSAQALAFLGSGDLPTGGSVTLAGMVTFV